MSSIAQAQGPLTGIDRTWEPLDGLSGQRLLASRPREKVLLLVVSAAIACGALLLASVLEVPWQPWSGERLRPLWLWIALLWAAHTVLAASRYRGDEHVVPLVGALAGVGLLVMVRLETGLESIPEVRARVPDAHYQQATYLTLGLTIMLVVALARWHTSWLRRLDNAALLVGAALLLWAAILGEGPGGTQIQLRVGPLQFQPIEVLKVVLVVFLAGFLSKRLELVQDSMVLGPFPINVPALGIHRPTVFLPPFNVLIPLLLAPGVLALVAVKILDDTGAVLLLYGVCLALIYAAVGWRSWGIAGLIILLSFGALAYYVIPGVRTRINVWWDPWASAPERAHQSIQGLLALRDGGLLGAGLGRGEPLHVPAIHTDFPFVAFAEEAGFGGALAVLTLYALLILRGLRIAALAPDTYRRLLAAGLTAILAMQVFVIVGGNVRMLPLTGVTLPFISFGGTSLVLSFFIAGILLRISQEGQTASAGAPLGQRSYGQDMDDRVRNAVVNLGVVAGAGFTLLAAFTFFWQLGATQTGTLAAGLGRASAAFGQKASQDARPIGVQLRTQRGRILDRSQVVLARSESDPAQRQYDPRRMRRVVSSPAASVVTGYFYPGAYESAALEQRMDWYLSGQFSLWPWASIWHSVTRAPRVGYDVETTIDLRLQEAAARILDRRSGDRPVRGSIVVLHPQSGEVLAMVTSPTYDANTLRQEWTALNRRSPDPLLDAKPLLNRAAQEVYSPGSTFKLVTAAAALDLGLVRPSDLFTDAPFEIPVPGAAPYVVRNANNEYGDREPVSRFRRDAQGRPQLDFARGLAYSSNVVFSRVGLDVGEPRLREYAGKFGIGTTLPFELVTTQTHFSNPAPAALPRSVLAMTAFGQGELAVTPLQMALVGATIANDGVVPRPTLVRAIREPGGRVIEHVRHQPVGRAIKPETASTLRGMMTLVVEEGHGWMACVPTVRVAGKTGTAQTPANVPDHSWFVALAPAEKPTIAVAVMMEYSGWGSLEAAPVARQVIEEAIRLKYVEPSATTKPCRELPR